jgi:hypothetical protein
MTASDRNRRHRNCIINRQIRCPLPPALLLQRCAAPPTGAPPSEVVRGLKPLEPAFIAGPHRD